MGFFYFGKKKKNHGKVDNCMELLFNKAFFSKSVHLLSQIVTFNQ